MAKHINCQTFRMRKSTTKTRRTRKYLKLNSHVLGVRNDNGCSKRMFPQTLSVYCTVDHMLRQVPPVAVSTHFARGGGVLRATSTSRPEPDRESILVPKLFHSTAFVLYCNSYGTYQVASKATPGCMYKQQCMDRSAICHTWYSI